MHHGTWHVCIWTTTFQFSLSYSEAGLSGFLLLCCVLTLLASKKISCVHLPSPCQSAEITDTHHGIYLFFK